VLHSPPTRRTSLLEGLPSDPWEGHRHKTCNALRSDGSPSLAATTDGNVDPPLLPWPTMSAASNGDPSYMERVPPIPRVVIGCLECYCGARVWLQDQLSRLLVIPNLRNGNYIVAMLVIRNL
jgi:hypothetical protein